MKVLWPKSVTLRGVIISGIFAVIAALVSRPWVCEDKPPKLVIMQILDKHTRLVVPNVYVEIRPSGIYGTTNENGNFSFAIKQATKEKLSIVISKMGYKTRTLVFPVDSLNLGNILIEKADVYDSVRVGHDSVFMGHK